MARLDPLEQTVERTFPAQRARISGMIDFVRAAAAQRGVPERIQTHLALITDEAVVNICDYAYPGNRVVATDLPQITMALRRSDPGPDRPRIELTITDFGLPFDPLSNPAPDTACPLDDRPCGGLGILLIKRFATEVDYRREGGHNILTIRIAWTDAGPDETSPDTPVSRDQKP